MGILFRKGMLQLLSCPSLLERIHIQHTRGSIFRRKSTFENDHGEQKLSCERDTAPEIIEGAGKDQTASKLPTSAKCTHTLPVVSITRPSVKRGWERCMWAQLYEASQQRPCTQRQGWIFPMKIEHKTHRLVVKLQWHHLLWSTQHSRYNVAVLSTNSSMAWTGKMLSLPLKGPHLKERDGKNERPQTGRDREGAHTGEGKDSGIPPSRE